MFNIGQKVVCVKSGTPIVEGVFAPHRLDLELPIIGQVYMVKNTVVCCKQWVDVGLAVTPSNDVNICPHCKERLGQGIKWCQSSLFAPLVDETAAEEAVQELIQSAFKSQPVARNV